MTEAQTLTAALDRAGYRLTEPRRRLAELVAARDEHFTALELVAEAKRRRLGLGRATVFRTLELLAEVGLVERLDLPSGDHAYVGCEAAHHHHVVCARCRRGVEVEDCGLAAVAEEVERRTGYAIASHRLELFGLCPACQLATRQRPGSSS